MELEYRYSENCGLISKKPYNKKPTEKEITELLEKEELHELSQDSSRHLFLHFGGLVEVRTTVNAGIMKINRYNDYYQLI